MKHCVRLACALAIGAAVIAPRAGAGVAAGARVAVACTGCHGPGGRSRGAVPSLAGMDAQRFEQRMAAFRRGHGTIMNRIAPAYSDEAVALMARYFAAQRPAGKKAHPQPPTGHDRP